MSGTYTCILLHIVFSTKERRRFLTENVRQRLYDYLGGAVRKRNGVLYAAGGTDDHVHLLIRWRPDDALSDLMRDVKSGSSGWLHRITPEKADFAWQDGFSAFSVSSSNMAAVRGYIRDQARHHAESSFMDELRVLLDRHEVPYDEEYIWR